MTDLRLLLSFFPFMDNETASNESRHSIYMKCLLLYYPSYLFQIIQRCAEINVQHVPVCQYQRRYRFYTSDIRIFHFRLVCAKMDN